MEHTRCGAPSEQEESALSSHDRTGRRSDGAKKEAAGGRMRPKEPEVDPKPTDTVSTGEETCAGERKPRAGGGAQDAQVVADGRQKAEAGRQRGQGKLAGIGQNKRRRGPRRTAGRGHAAIGESGERGPQKQEGKRGGPKPKRATDETRRRQRALRGRGQRSDSHCTGGDGRKAKGRAALRARKRERRKRERRAIEQRARQGPRGA